MYRVVLQCNGINPDEGPDAAQDITREFAEHRRHHRNVICQFENGTLTLTAENDWDPKALALMDEFSDCISAYIKDDPGDGNMIVKSIIVIE